MWNGEPEIPADHPDNLPEAEVEPRPRDAEPYSPSPRSGVRSSGSSSSISFVKIRSVRL